MDPEEDFIENNSDIEEIEDSDVEDIDSKPIDSTKDVDLGSSDIDQDMDDDIDDDIESDIESDIELDNRGITQSKNTQLFELSDSDDDSDDENYLQKFENNIQEETIDKYHPELHHHNYDDIKHLSVATRNENGVIVDPLHRTMPFVTKYEKARVIGERTKQINNGALPMIEVEPTVIDGYLIALKEFEEKKIPFIIKRPLPNGGCEYWKLSDLEILV
jgi:DNA-directed RNA polymerase I, II, and III subunit RPABC2